TVTHKAVSKTSCHGASTSRQASQHRAATSRLRSGVGEWGFIGDLKLQGFWPKHTKPCNPKRTKPKLQHAKSMP
ncbi:hypothetical protein, partial [Paracoccus alcaliphilus]|uniref:hypothetical protein n=1 Tax=Paracoccus alcaliphilus TaxID=34002 RepID=UPI001B8B6DBD